MGAGDATRRLDREPLPRSDATLRGSQGDAARKVVAGAAAVAATGLLAASVWAAHEPPFQGGPAGDVTRVGMEDGLPVGAYVDQAARELDELRSKSGERAYALVSFDAFISPGRYTELVSTVSAYRAYAKPQTPGGSATVVEITVTSLPQDLVSGMRAVADRRKAQATRYRQDAGTLTGGSEAERNRRARYLAAASVADAEAAAYRSMCSCLYAAVVWGAPDRLGRLSRASEVRVVDVAPEVGTLEHVTFVPPLPELPAVPAESGPCRRSHRWPSHHPGSRQTCRCGDRQGRRREPRPGSRPISAQMAQPPKGNAAPKRGGGGLPLSVNGTGDRSRID